MAFSPIRTDTTRIVEFVDNQHGCIFSVLYDYFLLSVQIDLWKRGGLSYLEVSLGVGRVLLWFAIAAER